MHKCPFFKSLCALETIYLFNHHHILVEVGIIIICFLLMQCNLHKVAWQVKAQWEFLPWSRLALCWFSVAGSCSLYHLTSLCMFTKTLGNIPICHIQHACFILPFHEVKCLSLLAFMIKYAALLRSRRKV
jgi:hypothetical protein